MFLFEQEKNGRESGVMMMLALDLVLMAQLKLQFPAAE